VNHQYWMAHALGLARNGLYSTHPNPRVGCVVVKNEELVAQGWHEFTGGPHAEINAIDSARVPVGSDFYVTLEPCSHQGRTPPCVDALIRLKPKRVIMAMQDPNPGVAGQGVARLEAAGIEVIKGVLESEARALNPGFISRMLKGRPFVRLKMAMSLDGRTALKNGSSQWISGEAARKDVQFLRARSSAILTSASTVIKDDLVAAGAKVEVMKNNQQDHIQLASLMSHLAKREINEVHTECGQILAGALLQAQLVDEMIIYMSPQLMGSQSRGAFELGELTRMSDSVHCSIEQMRKIGDDMRLTLSLKSEVNA